MRVLASRMPPCHRPPVGHKGPGVLPRSARCVQQGGGDGQLSGFHLCLRMANTKVEGVRSGRGAVQVPDRRTQHIALFNLFSPQSSSPFAPCPLYHPPHKDIQLALFPRSKREPQGVSCRLPKTRGLNTPQPARLAPAPSFFFHHVLVISKPFPFLFLFLALSLYRPTSLSFGPPSW